MPRPREVVLEVLQGQIDALHQTLDEMGAPHVDTEGRGLNPNGRLEDWLAGRRKDAAPVSFTVVQHPPNEPAVLVAHLEAYLALCNRPAARTFSGMVAPAMTMDQWNYELIVDILLEPGDNFDERRMVVHTCDDGESYAWNCGGWYLRKQAGDWELEVALDYGGDSDCMSAFWVQHIGFVERPKALDDSH